MHQHAVAVALALREQVAAENDLLERLAADGRLGIALPELQALISQPLDFTGAAGQQVAAVVERVNVLATAHPDAAAYHPGDIL